jgi:hemolysin D
MKLYYEAFREFLKRYTGIFKSVWAIREQLDPPARSTDELAFLPAQLELIETPVSPVPKYTVRIIMLMFVVALLWACLGKLDIVAVAGGKTVPGGRTKIIQPLEAAVVKAIYVKDGQHVEANQLLIELDATGTAADSQKASDALISAGGSKARYQSLLVAIDSGQAPKPFTIEDADNSVVATENSLARSEYNTFVAKRAAQNSALAQREAELATTRTLIVSLAESASIAKTRVSEVEKLLEKKFISQQDYLQVKQASISADQNLAGQRGRIAELQAAIATQRQERDALVADFRRQLNDGLRQSSEQVAQFGSDASKAQRRDDLMQLRAPVSGTVQQLAIHTVGGVVTPAQPLLAVVPEGEALEVEAMVLNKDIGFVREGQQATIKVESFPYTRYGYLEGVVESVSHDAMQDENLGLVYQARVRLKKSTLMIDGVKVNLSSGMALSVEIKTGKRRVITYLLSPLQQHTEEALRER